MLTSWRREQLVDCLVLALLVLGVDSVWWEGDSQYYGMVAGMSAVHGAALPWIRCWKQEGGDLFFLFTRISSLMRILEVECKSAECTSVSATHVPVGSLSYVVSYRQ